MGTSTRILAVAFVAVVAAFIGSTILVQRESRVIDADATLISRDAAPGIQVISNLRVELREMQTRALRVIESGAPGAEVADSRRRLDQLLEQAVGLPTDAHEALLLGKLHSAVRAFDEATERALEQARGGGATGPPGNSMRSARCLRRPLPSPPCARCGRCTASSRRIMI